MLQLARDQGTAFIMVTHDESLAARCARRYRLVEGRLSKWETVAQGGFPIHMLGDALAKGPQLETDERISMAQDMQRSR